MKNHILTGDPHPDNTVNVGVEALRLFDSVPQINIVKIADLQVHNASSQQVFLILFDHLFIFGTQFKMADVILVKPRDRCLTAWGPGAQPF